MAAAAPTSQTVPIRSLCMESQSIFEPELFPQGVQCTTNWATRRAYSPHIPHNASFWSCSCQHSFHGVDVEHKYRLLLNCCLKFIFHSSHICVQWSIETIFKDIWYRFLGIELACLWKVNLCYDNWLILLVLLLVHNQSIFPMSDNWINQSQVLLEIWSVIKKLKTTKTQDIFWLA